MSKLDEICTETRAEVARRKAQRSLGDLDAISASPPRGFISALHGKAAEGTALIAEIKRASPSKGLIRAEFDPPAHARAYERGGAACLSVLTDAPFFQGHEDDLVAARAACALPVLRKDFMVDPWQVAESRAIGADAILVIMAALDDEAAAEIEAAAVERGMDVLVEVHDDAELDRGLRLRSRLIGVNSRDLRTFETDPGLIHALVADAPPGVTFVAESGIATHDDLAALRASGVRCALVGESLMRCGDLEAATRRLLTGA